MEEGARPVIDPNLLEPAALQQMHGGIKHELETMTEARYGMARVAESCMAAKDRLLNMVKKIGTIDVGDGCWRRNV